MADVSDSQREFLTTRYQKLWDGSFDFVRRGEVVIDPLLARREADRRRCISAVIRPSLAIQGVISAFLDELRAVEPDQYYYDVSELHVTVLSLFTATLDHARLLVRYEDYLAATRAALAQAPEFEIEFTGVTLSREAIMIQGFPVNAVLNNLREALRRELRSRDLTEGLDGRYLLQTAHMTAARFRAPLRAGDALSQIVQRYQKHEFGTTRATELQFVRNDWYMSRSVVEVLQRFPLG